MIQSVLDTFSFYFNYDYGRKDDSLSDVKNNEAYVNHIVETFYKSDLGKIVKVHDMVSECGRFFIISFNKETWNWSNSLATSIYEKGFPVDTWGCKHITNNENTVTFENDAGDNWNIYLTSIPDIDIKTEFFGKYSYDIIWSINENDEEQETFKINIMEIDKPKSDDEEHLSNSIYCVDENNLLSCKCGGCPDNDYSEINIDNNDNKWKHWGGDNSWVEYTTDDGDVIEWMTKEKKEQQFYENWAAELDELSSKYCGNNWIEKNIWSPKEYKYDLMDMKYSPSSHGNEDDDDDGCKLENGYTVYTKDEFINYYGEQEGTMRWNSDIYSAHCMMEGDSYIHEPPEGCKLKYNISYLILKVCHKFNNDDDFNISRTILRKYVDKLWSLTDPTDTEINDKPVITLRADYNSNLFSVSCWYNFKYTNLYDNKLKTVENLVKKIKSHEYFPNGMIDWIPSLE